MNFNENTWLLLVKLIKEAAIFGIKSNPNIDERALNSQLANFESTKIELIEAAKSDVDSSLLLARFHDIERRIEHIETALSAFDNYSGHFDHQTITSRIYNFKERVQDTGKIMILEADIHSLKESIHRLLKEELKNNEKRTT